MAGNEADKPLIAVPMAKADPRMWVQCRSRSESPRTDSGAIQVRHGGIGGTTRQQHVGIAFVGEWTAKTFLAGPSIDSFDGANVGTIAARRLAENRVGLASGWDHRVSQR